MTASSVWRLVRSVFGYLAVFLLILAALWGAMNLRDTDWMLPFVLVVLLVGGVAAMNKIAP